jgi:hypothetical protein
MIWWEKGALSGNGAAMRRGDAVAIWWVCEMRWRILGENGSISPTGMAHGIFGRSRPPALSFNWVRRMKKHPTPDEKSVWGARLGGIFGDDAPKRCLGGLRGASGDALTKGPLCKQFLNNPLFYGFMASPNNRFISNIFCV